MLFLLIVGLFLFSSCQLEQEDTVSKQDFLKVKERLSSLESRVGILEESFSSLGDMLNAKYVTKAELQDKLGKQIDRISKVLESISKTNEELSKPSGTKSKKKDKNIDALYKKARKLHQSRQYTKALNIYKQLKNTRIRWYKERVIFFTADVLYQLKKYRKSIIQMQNFLDTFPKSKFRPSGILLQIKALVKLHKKQDAKLILEELKDKYPDSKQYRTAKKLLGQ